MAVLQKINARFRARLDRREPMLGAFIKTPHPIVIEIMAPYFDFLVLDAEHAPFDRHIIDTMIIAGMAYECPIIVRIPAATSAWMLNCLDAGAAGLMVPHVLNAEHAKKLAKAIAYVPGGRGFAGTTRAAEYARRPLNAHLTSARAEIALICQIEDPEGAQNADAIAGTDGVDALFVGRADLAVSHGGNDFHDAEIARMTKDILGLNGAATGLYCTPDEPLKPLRDAGSCLFVVGSDHSLIKESGTFLRQRFEQL